MFLFNRRVLDFSASIPDEVVLGPVDVHCMLKYPIAVLIIAY